MINDQTLKKTKDASNVICYAVMRRLLNRYDSWDAFKLGLIDTKGNILKVPETPEEQQALTSVDLMALELKKIMGGNINRLNTFSYLLKNQNFDELSSLLVTKGIQHFGIIKKIESDLKLRSKINS